MQLWNVHMLAVKRRQKYSFKSERAPQSCKLQQVGVLQCKQPIAAICEWTKSSLIDFSLQKSTQRPIWAYILFSCYCWPTALKQRVSNITWETSTGKSKAGTQKHNHHTLWVFTNSTRVLHIEISPQAFRAGEIWWSSHCVSVTSPDAGIRKEEEEEEEEPVNIVRFNWMCLEESLVLKTVNLWVGTYRGNWKTHTHASISTPFTFPGVIPQV